MNHRAVDSVAEEIANAKAEALGLAGRRLEDALRALRELDSHASRHDAGRRDAGKRAMLLAAAADRLLAVLVQREALGLRDTSYVLKFHAVPAEIVARLGIRADAGHRQAAR